MNKENDRYCVLFAKNLLLSGSYALPVYSSHDAKFIILTRQQKRQQWNSDAVLK